MTLSTFCTTIYMLLLIHCNAQHNFNWTDSVFQVGQIKRVNVEYQLSGGCYPIKESLLVLDTIAEFLKKNKNLRIEIATHSDFRGNSKMNNKLTELQALRVVDYLIVKGINANRLKFKGYGELYPKTVDFSINKSHSFLSIGQKLTKDYIEKLDSKEKQETANAINRRTEIRIIEI